MSVCLSVHRSVTFRYCDHIGWNCSKIISRPNSVRPMRGRTPTWAIWCNGNTPTIRWNRSGVTQEDKKTCNISETVQDKTKVTNGLIGRRIRAFDWYQNQWPWVTLNGVSRDCPKFLEPTIIPGTGKATGFKFGRYINRIHPNKSPLKIFGEKGAWVYPGTVQIF